MAHDRCQSMLQLRVTWLKHFFFKRQRDSYFPTRPKDTKRQDSVSHERFSLDPSNSSVLCSLLRNSIASAPKQKSVNLNQSMSVILSRQRDAKLNTTNVKK